MSRLTIGGLLLLVACAQENPSVPAVCAAPTKGCNIMLGGGSVQVSFSEVPQPMKTFEISLEGRHLGEVQLEFSMAGMDMGPAVYRLARDQDGLLRTKAALPVCMAGRADWIMTLRSGSSESAILFQAGR